MFTFFDYLFYKVCEFYRKREKDDSGFRFEALAIVMGMQGFNLLSLLFFIELLSHKKIIIPKVYLIIFAAVLLIMNGIMHNSNKYNYAILKEKRKNEEEKLKKKKENRIIVYIILSTVLFLGLAIYLGTKKW